MAMTCIGAGRECDGCLGCQEPKPENIAGACAECGEPVMKYEARYEFPNGRIVHDDCVIEFIRKNFYHPA